MTKTHSVKDGMSEEVQRASAFRLGPVCWVPTEEMGRQQWLITGRRIGAMGRASGWWVGDWLRYGTARWGEKYVAAARVTGYDVQTLRNMVYVASKFDLSQRRDNLSWSHHAVLAALTSEEQKHWLDRASEEKLSVADLQLELRASRKLMIENGHSQMSGRRREEICPNCGFPLKEGKTKSPAAIVEGRTSKTVKSG